jgi:hypothetical protein
MDKVENDALKAIVSILLSLGSLVAGITLLSLGTNLYIGLGVFFLVLYFNSTRE